MVTMHDGHRPLASGAHVIHHLAASPADLCRQLRWSEPSVKLYDAVCGTVLKTLYNYYWWGEWVRFAHVTGHDTVQACLWRIAGPRGMPIALELSSYGCRRDWLRMAGRTTYFDFNISESAD
jgi:hypothetical protein